MAFFRRILNGLLAALLLVQPVVALGDCCCKTRTNESSITEPGVAESGTAGDGGETAAVSAGCPRCRAAAAKDESGQQSSTPTLQSDDCGCSREGHAVPATLSEKRDVRSEVVVRTHWLPLETCRIPNVRRLETSQVVRQTGIIPLTVLHCRWQA